MTASLGDLHWAGHPLVHVMYERQSASAAHSVWSVDRHAPPSGSTDACKQTSHASPVTETVPSAQYSDAQAVSHAPLAPQSHAWMSATSSLTPVACKPWQQLTQLAATSAWQVVSPSPASTEPPLLLPLPLPLPPPLPLPLLLLPASAHAWEAWDWAKAQSEHPSQVNDVESTV